MSGKGTYVWDEWSDEETNQKLSGERDFVDELNDSRSSFSSLGFESRTAKSSIIDTARTETLSKVKKLQADLKAKQTEVNQLHAEYKRIKLAKERRIEKCRNTMEGKLSTVREENKLAADKLEVIHQKLVADVQKLREQVRGLEQRMIDNKANQQHALDRHQRDAQKRLARAKRQWEVDEAASFENVIKSKAELLEKQAAESLDPKLKKMVEDGKRKVSEARDSGEARLQQVQLALSAEHEKKLTEIRGKLTEQLQHDVDKMKRQLQRQHEETLKQLQSEIVALQEKFQREKTNLEEAHERTQQLEQQQLQDALQSLSKQEVKQTTELLEKQQREIGYLTETLTAEMNRLKQTLREQQEQSAQRASQLQAALREQALQRRKDGVIRKLATETERILQKLREDAEQERAKMRRRYEEQVSEVRDKAQRELESRQDKQQREMSRIGSLNAEIATFQAQCQRLQQAENAAKSTLTERLQPTLAELRRELREVENEFQLLAPRQKAELQARRTEKKQEVAVLESKLQGLQESVEEQRRQQEDRLEEVEAKHVTELTRIKEKVHLLLKRKDAARAELVSRLDALQAQSVQLEGALEDLRATALAN